MTYKIRVILDNDNDEDVFKDFEVSKNINLTKFHEYIKKNSIYRVVKWLLFTLLMKTGIL